MVLESARIVDVLIRRKMRWCFHRLERTPFRDAPNVKQPYTAPERVKRSTGVLTSRIVVRLLNEIIKLGRRRRRAS